MGMKTGLLFLLVAALLLWVMVVFTPPQWLFPVVLFLIFIFYSNTIRERVPLYLSNKKAWMVLSELLGAQNQSHGKRPTFMDLGCGLGGTLTFLAREHADWDVHGVETALGPYLISKMRSFFLPNVTVHFQSLWTVDLGHVDVAYAFLSPAPMKRLCQKVENEMKVGSLFVSNSFWPDDVPFDVEFLENNIQKGRFFCWWV